MIPSSSRPVATRGEGKSPNRLRREEMEDIRMRMPDSTELGIGDVFFLLSSIITPTIWGVWALLFDRPRCPARG